MDETLNQVYSRGTRTFLGVTLLVQPGVLIPREETELLAKTALEILKGTPSPRVIDMCSGCGNLGCVVAVNYPQARVWAADATEACVELTAKNIAKLELGERMTVSKGDLFASLDAFELQSSIDLVVCNPPYIPSNSLERDLKHLLVHEPREAFDAGPYGVNVIQTLVKTAPLYLRSGAPLCFEFGAGQEKLVKRLLEQSELYRASEFRSNTTGTPRVALAYAK